MKVVCNSSMLVDGVRAAARVVSQRATLPILQNIKIEAVLGEEGGKMLITGTDMNTCVKKAIPVEEIEVEGATTVPAKLFLELVEQFREAKRISLELRGNLLFLRDEDSESEHSLPTVPADEFPLIPELAKPQVCEISQSMLRKMIRRSAFAAATEESAGVCTGILVEIEGDKLTLVATDTHRMSVVRTSIPTPMQERVEAIIPATVMREIHRLLSDADEPVKLAIDVTHMQIETGDMQCITLKMQGQFPNYKRVIPTQFARRLVIDTKEFITKIKRVALHANEDIPQIVMRISKDKLIIVAEDPEAGRGKGKEVLLPIEYEGEPIIIAFNADFMAEFLSNVESPTTLVEMNENRQPVVMRPTLASEGEEWIYIAMPMQPPEETEF
ncbi:MAG: DNA polymerase III subunit beta [Armatimonadota bacterium]|nr:DNA polymerase III subunit beta [Armatimonadota bacterium]MCX7776451.1 DNA polymerase III subunit beta [Armatimonadota bacterium]MDW8024249.1 DNA polymerase III subunit beta [Armatimonadota bacterium]